MTIRVSRVDGVEIPAAQDRRAIYSGWTTGILASGDGLVEAQSTPNMTVKVATISGLLVDDGVSFGNGRLVFESDAIENVAIDTSDATNPRIDLVVAKVEAVEFGDGSDSFTLDTVPGTPAASPSAPATPARCYKLAEVRVEAGVTSIVAAKITDRRSLASTGPKIQRGTFSTTFTSDTVKTGTLTFPEAFATAPVMVGTVTIGSNLRVSVGWDANPTTTQVQWRAFQAQGVSISGAATVHWIAIGT